jgi:predicted nuclease of predicted toxin-antitoxin system
MRFYLDENLSPLIALLARALGVDIVSAQERGEYGTSDGRQLELAAAEGRCLVTCDVPDFARRTGEFFAANKPHAGVLNISWNVRRDDVGRVARLIARFAAENPDGLQPYEIRWLANSLDA